MNAQTEDERLMALVDGELPEAEAQALRDRMRADPALAARADQFRQTRDLLSGIAPDPVPAELEARIRALAGQAAVPAPSAAEAPPAPVIQLASRRRSLPVWQALAGMAAALIIGVALGGYGTGPQGGGDGIAAALASLPSGESATADEETVTMIASFTDSAGGLCREYEAVSGGQMTVAVACHDGSNWQTRLTLAAGPAEGYVPAATFDILDRWMMDNGASAPLSEAEEARALTGL